MKKYLIKISLVLVVILGIFTFWSVFQTTPVSAATYTVTFDLQCGDGSISPQSMTANQKTRLVSVYNSDGKAKITKTGFKFKGWSTLPDREVVYPDGSLFPMRRGNTTIYAVWKSVCTYNIIFNANGGVQTMTAQEMTIGIPQNLTANKFAKRGLYFGGWALTDGVNETATYQDKESYVRNFFDSNDVTLYAVWTKAPRTITFNANGGTGASSTQTIVTAEKDYLRTNTYERVGYKFDGWATTATGKVVYYDGALYTIGTVNVTLYAKWSQEPGSTMITFNPNWKVCTENQGCPQSGTGIMAPQLIPAGSTTTKLNANTFRPSQRCEISPIGKKECWDAYGFTGWRTAASVSVPGQKGYSDKAVFLPIPGVPSITLYANWYPYGAAAPDSHNYASVLISWESFLKLLQILR